MKTRGFSYIEIITALALFSILIMAALPLLNQAGRNLAFAQDGYAAHLAAQSLMLAVRDALGENKNASDITDAQSAAAEYASRLGVESYSVFIFSENSGISFGSDCAPAIAAELTGLSGIAFSQNARAVVTIVWNEAGYVQGRAIGILGS
jgi:prepilin-type N-terminal cleavage/methylation domain-containing protein